MFCCLKGCLNGFTLTPNVPVRIRENPVQLDTTHMGHEVVVVKGGQRVCGSGCVLGNAPLVQSKSYFEVKLQQGGVWAVGLATRQTDLNRVHGGMDKSSWCLNSDGTVRHENVELYQLSPPRRETPPPADLLGESRASPVKQPLQSDTPSIPIEGDVIGVAYDHIEINFYVHGKSLDIPVRNVKGTVYPALYVNSGLKWSYGKIRHSMPLATPKGKTSLDDGAILDVILDNFLYPPPPGFDKIMIEQSLL